MNDFFSTYTNYLENASLLSDKDRLSHAMLKTVSSVSGRSRYRETVRHGGTCFLKLKIFASEPQVLSVVKKYFIFFGEFHLVRFKEKKMSAKYMSKPAYFGWPVFSIDGFVPWKRDGQPTLHGNGCT